MRRAVLVNASTIGPLGVTLRGDGRSAFFTHAAIDRAPANSGNEGGVIVTDEQGRQVREWVLDEAWMAQYRAAVKALATTHATEYNSNVGA